MIPVIVKRYTGPPCCGLAVRGRDVQSDDGEIVRCPKPAVVKVQIEEGGNTMNLCEEHLELLGKFDWEVKPRTADRTIKEGE